jgi:hypothetical protein
MYCGHKASWSGAPDVEALLTSGSSRTLSLLNIAIDRGAIRRASAAFRRNTFAFSTLAFIFAGVRLSIRIADAVADSAYHYVIAPRANGMRSREYAWRQVFAL